MSLLTLLILNNSSNGVLFVNSTYFQTLNLSCCTKFEFSGSLWYFCWSWWAFLIFFEFSFFKTVFSLHLKYLKKHHFQRVRPFVRPQFEWDIDLGRPFRRRSSKGLTLTKYNFNCLVKPTVLTMAGRKVTSLLRCSLYLLTVQWHPYCAHAYADAVKSFYLWR